MEHIASIDITSMISFKAYGWVQWILFRRFELSLPHVQEALRVLCERTKRLSKNFSNPELFLKFKQIFE